jgi:hypothetical protein
MASTKSRVPRRRYHRVPALDRPMLPAEPPAVLPSAGVHDPRESRVETGMRPYETRYDISHGYTGERAIVLR